MKILIEIEDPKKLKVGGIGSFIADDLYSTFDIECTYREVDETVVDEKKLDEFARECSTSFYGFDNDYEPNREDVEYGFKKGYLKGVER